MIDGVIILPEKSSIRCMKRPKNYRFIEKKKAFNIAKVISSSR